MTQFDPKLWKDRSWARLVKACRGRVSDDPVVQKLEKKWYLETVAISDMEKLLKWCNSRKLTVEFVVEQLGTYVMGKDKIRISCRLSPRKQVVILLHECGHHLCGVSDTYGRFLAGYSESNLNQLKSFRHRLSCLEEEVESWNRGWKLSSKLGLSIDRSYFDEVRSDCLRSYVKWAANPNEV